MFLIKALKYYKAAAGFRAGGIDFLPDLLLAGIQIDNADLGQMSTF